MEKSLCELYFPNINLVSKHSSNLPLISTLKLLRKIVGIWGIIYFSSLIIIGCECSGLSLLNLALEAGSSLKKTRILHIEFYPLEDSKQ